MVFSSGGVDKLEVWRRLAVPEVWIWNGLSARLVFHVMHDGEYRFAERSRFVPELDPALIVECMAEPTQGQAIARLLARMRPA